MLERAAALEHAGARDDAVALLTDWLRRSPQSHKHRLRAMRLLEQAGKLAELEQHIRFVKADASAPAALARVASEALYRQHRYADALAILDGALAKHPAQPDLLTARTDVLLAQGHLDEAARALEPLASAAAADARTLLALAVVQTAQNRLQDAAQSLARAEQALAAGSLPEALAARVAPRVVRARDYVRMLRDTSAIVTRVAQPAGQRGLVLVVTNGSPQVCFMTSLTAVQLRRQGWAVIYPCSEGLIDAGASGDPAIDAFQGMLDYSQKRLAGEQPGRTALRHSWQVDWAARSVSAEGMNFYQLFFETLCTEYRRYSIEIDSIHFRSAFQDLLLQADAMLALCKRVEAFSRERRIPVRIFSAKPHFVPNGVLRVFCEERGHQHDINFVRFGAGYDHYYANATNRFINTISVENLTRYRSEQRLSVHARRSQFEAWLASGVDEEKILERVRGIVQFNRTHVQESPPEAAQVQAELARARSEGRPVVCLFGKILYDIAMPTDGGPAHRDLRDWINHSLECAARSDALVLVKPHPNEVKKTYAQPAERFTDLIHVPLAPNVRVLEHRWFNIRDLLPFLSLGILWSGSTALELGASGVPVVVCSDWGRKDYPVDFLAPESREDYARFFREAGRFSVDESHQRRCALLIHYLSTEEIMTPFPYARMPVRHREYGPKEWRLDEVERFFREGDPHIDRITAKCL